MRSEQGLDSSAYISGEKRKNEAVWGVYFLRKRERPLTKSRTRSRSGPKIQRSVNVFTFSLNFRLNDLLKYKLKSNLKFVLFIFCSHRFIACLGFRRFCEMAKNVENIFKIYFSIDPIKRENKL